MPISPSQSRFSIAQSGKNKVRLRQDHLRSLWWDNDRKVVDGLFSTARERRL